MLFEKLTAGVEHTPLASSACCDFRHNSKEKAFIAWKRLKKPWCPIKRGPIKSGSEASFTFPFPNINWGFVARVHPWIPGSSRVWLLGKRESWYSVIKCLIWTHLVNLKSKWRKDLNHLSNAVLLFLTFFFFSDYNILAALWHPSSTPDGGKKGEGAGEINLLLGLGSVGLKVWGEFTGVIHRSTRAG